MAVIKVAGPDGSIQRFQIAGDKPTEEEITAIHGVLTGGKVGGPPSSEGSQYTSATLEQIRAYAQQKRQLGITPEGTKMTPEEAAAVPYEEQGVDYTQGLQDIGNFSRFGYGRMETDQERANYLAQKIGKDTFRKDPLGRFILTQKGRDALGMGKGPEVSIDEEGLSWGDVKEFLGQSALPLAAGIGAALTFSGVGTIPGILIAGGAAAAGKALDEGIEYAQGLQDQSFKDVMRDSAMEGVFSAAGEGAGRLVAKGFGRLIKGAAGPENEVLRKEGLDLIRQGYQPTIGGATNEAFRPILVRMQALYEKVFPNRKAALNNLNLIIEDLKGLRTVNTTAVDDLADAVKNDVDKLYSTADEDIVAAQKHLNDVIEKDLGKVMAGLRKDSVIPKDLVEVIQLHKRIFDENMDSIYTRVGTELKGQKIIPTDGIKRELQRLIETSPADVGITKFANMINSLPKYAEAAEVARIRTALSEASRNTELLNGASAGALGSLKASITSAMNNTEVAFAQAIKNPLGVGDTIVGPGEFTGNFADLTTALGILRRTNNLYRNGMKRFDSAVTQKLIKEYQTQGYLNEKFILDSIIEEDNPEAFDQFMRAIRGTKYMENLPAGERAASQQLVMGDTLEQAKAKMAAMTSPAQAQARRLLAQEIQRVESKGALARTAAGRGAESAELVRQNLANMYLQRALGRSKVVDKSTGLEVIDPKAFVAEMRSKGSVFDKLFRGEKDQLNDLISVLDRQGADIAPSVLDDLMARNATVTEAMTTLKDLQLQRGALEKGSFRTVLASGDIDRISKDILRSTENVNMARNSLDPNTFERVKDEAMGRILQQADIATGADGEIKMTNDFLEAFTSGRLGNRLQHLIDSYGDKNLDALFGSGTSKSLNDIASNMVRTSNASLAGKSGLAAASIALGLSGVHVLLSPVATLPTAAGFAVMSKLLRSKTVLRGLLASRSQNTIKQVLSGKILTGDPFGQALQVVQQMVAQAAVQSGRGTYEQGKEEIAPAINYATQQNYAKVGDVGKAIANNPITKSLESIATDAKRAITAGPPQARPQISPILVPNPSTRATFGQ
jgi:hypothetical protein